MTNAHKTRRHIRQPLRWIILAVVLLLPACAGGGLSEEALATVAAGEQNQEQLSLTTDVARTELLDGNTGSITTLADVVTGDRPVLVWYWAPD